MASSIVSLTFPSYLLAIAATILDATASRALQRLKADSGSKGAYNGGAYDWYMFATMGTDKLIVNNRLDALLNPLSIGIYIGKIGHFWIAFAEGEDVYRSRSR